MWGSVGSGGGRASATRKALATLQGPWRAQRLGQSARRCSARRGRLGIASEHARILAAPAVARRIESRAAPHRRRHVCPHHETERGAAAKVLGRTGSEGVREGFREQSWKGCLLAVCGPCCADTGLLRIWGLHSEICRLVP